MLYSLRNVLPHDNRPKIDAPDVECSKSASQLSGEKPRLGAHAVLAPTKSRILSLPGQKSNLKGAASNGETLKSSQVDSMHPRTIQAADVNVVFFLRHLSSHLTSYYGRSLDDYQRSRLHGTKHCPVQAPEEKEEAQPEDPTTELAKQKQANMQLREQLHLAMQINSELELAAKLAADEATHDLRRQLNELRHKASEMIHFLKTLNATVSGQCFNVFK